MVYGADYKFWKVYLAQIRERCTGEFWTVSEQAREQFGLYWCNYGRTEGFNPDPHTINGGGNSGYQAVHLAATFGATKIILIGYDMQRTGGKEHWHGKHEGNLANGSGFVSWRARFVPLATDLFKRDVDVVNCSRESALTAFRRGKLAQELP